MKNDLFIVELLKRLKKRIKIRTLLVLAITLSMNSFAWFIYANKIEGGIGATVKAWNVLFKSDSGELLQKVDIDVTEIYPGKYFSKDITITNDGDTEGQLKFEIMSVTIFGETRTATEDGPITSDTLLNSITHDYPFVITPSFTNAVVAPNSSENFNLSVEWPFDSGNDELDTNWGNRAYEYKKTNPSKPSIKLTIKIWAEQELEEQQEEPTS